MSGIFLRSLCTLTSLAIMTTLWGKHCYYAHFIHMAPSYLLEVTQIVAELGFKPGDLDPGSRLLTTILYTPSRMRQLLWFPEILLLFIHFFSIIGDCALPELHWKTQGQEAFPEILKSCLNTGMVQTTSCFAVITLHTHLWHLQLQKLCFRHCARH